jgi:hypothetical protein
MSGSIELEELQPVRKAAALSIDLRTAQVIWQDSYDVSGVQRMRTKSVDNATLVWLRAMYAFCFTIHLLQNVAVLSASCRREDADLVQRFPWETFPEVIGAELWNG